jgi:hypothetical protein
LEMVDADFWHDAWCGDFSLRVSFLNCMIFSRSRWGVRTEVTQRSGCRRVYIGERLCSFATDGTPIDRWLVRRLGKLYTPIVYKRFKLYEHQSGTQFELAPAISNIFAHFRYWAAFMLHYFCKLYRGNVRIFIVIR